MTKEKMKAVPKFGFKDKFGYMMGDFGCNMSFQLVTTFFMLFVTDALGISPFHFPILIIIAKIFDGINDPIIGSLVDSRRPGKHGKYKPWIFWGSIAIALSTALLFLDVQFFSYWGRFAYALIMYMIWSVAYTAANVPYGSLNAALTDKQNERASLSALRNIGAGVAMLPVLVIIPNIINEKVTNAEGVTETVFHGERFFWIALVCGIVGIVGFLCTIFLCKERRVEANFDEKPKSNYFQTLKGFFKNRAVVALSLASIAQIVFIQSYAALFPYVFKYFFQSEEIMGVANILAMAGMMIFIPFMGTLSGKFGKKEITSWPNLFGIVMLVIMLIVALAGGFPRNMNGAILYTVFFMISMIGGGTFFLATWGMVADCVDEQEIETGRRDEASIYATYSLSRKIAQGIGGAVISLCIGFCGYNSDNLSANFDESVATGILNTSIILPLIGFILIFVLLAFMYNLTRGKVEKNTELLREKAESYAINADEPTKCFYEENETEVNEEEASE